MPSAIMLCILAMLVSMALMVYPSSTMTDLNQTEAEEIINVYQNPIVVSILANELETRISKSGAILETTSRLPEVKSAPFANLQSFRSTINGESGTIREIINGTMILVSCHPVRRFSNVWTTLFMQPYDNIKEYNADYTKSSMDNNTNNEELGNEGSFKSKKGIQVSPQNESREVVNDSNVVQDIPRPGVPDEARFRELKHKANETIESNEQETVQENSVAQEDN